MEFNTFLLGIKQFNNQEFYACHDTLEALWIESSEGDRLFYQGILQVAVGCYHLGNNNWRGAVILLGEGAKKLSNYTPNYQKIDIDHLLENTLNLLANLQQIKPEDLPLFTINLNDTTNNFKLQYPHILMIDQK